MAWLAAKQLLLARVAIVLQPAGFGDSVKKCTSPRHALNAGGSPCTHMMSAARWLCVSGIGAATATTGRADPGSALRMVLDAYHAALSRKPLATTAVHR